MTDQREEHGSALTVPARALETGCETLFQHTLTVGIQDSDACILTRTDKGRIVFPYDAVKVEFLLHAAQGCLKDK